MSVKLSVEKGAAILAVTIDVTDLLELVGQSDAEKRSRILQRLQQELSQAIEAEQHSDAALDAQAAEAVARVAKLKAARVEVVAADELIQPK